MDGSLGIWLIGFLWLLTAPPLHGRGDTFEAEYTEREDADEAGVPSDDILDIKQAPSLPEGPESSLLMEGGIIQAVSHENPFWIFLSGNPRWPKKRGIVQIPYVISSRYDKSSVKIIQEALEDFARFTCIQFVPYSYQRDVVTIAPLSGCFSSIGRIDGKQVVSLAPACLRWGKRVVLHELRQVLGFWHQHSRADQDKYVGISWNEILTGFETNFLKLQKSNMLVDYDYSSVLHYGRNAFSMAGLPTTIPLFGASTSLGQKWRLSKSDIDQVNKLYECSQAVAEPETSTGRVIGKNTMDSVPSEAHPCSAENKGVASGPHSFSAAASVAECAPSTQETPSGSPNRKAVDEGTSVPEDHMKTTGPPGKGNQMPTVGSPETPGEGKNQEAFAAATGKRPHETTQSRETEMPSIGSAVKKASVALQSLTSRPRELGSQPPSSREAFFTTGQGSQEARMGTTAEMGSMPSFVSEGPASFSSDTVQEHTRRSGRKEVDEELLGTTRDVPIKRRTALSTLLGMGSSQGTRSTKSEGEGGSPNPTKGYGFSLAENGHKEQPKEMVHQDLSTPRNETGHPAHTSPVGNVHAKTMSSSYRAFASRISRNRATSSHVAELEGQPVSFAHIPTPHGMMGEALESSDGHKVSGPPSRWSLHGRKQDATHTLGHGLPPSKEVLPLVSAEAPGGTPFPWAEFTGHLAASWQKEGTNSWRSPASHSLGEEPFSPAPAHRARKRHRKVTDAKHTPLDAVFMKGERHTPDARVEAPSQRPTSEDWTSPVMKSDQVTPPMGETHLPRLPSPKTDGLRSRVSGLQSNSRDAYSSTAFSVPRAPSGDQQREEREEAIEAASTARGEKPTAGQRTSWIHEEEPGTRPSKETKTHGKVSLWRLVSKESWRSPVPTQHGHWVAGNQSARSPSFITGEGQGQRQTQSPLKLGTTVSLRQRSSFPGTKHPLTEETTKRKVSLHTQPKTGAIHGERPRGETKECSSASQGKPLPVTDMGARLSWVSGSSHRKEREGTGHYTGVPKGEASPASLSQLSQRPSQKRTQENPFSQGAHLSTSAGPSHFSILSVLRNPAFTSVSDSSPFLGTEWMMKSMSPAPLSLQLDHGKTLGSTPSVTILLAEGRPTQVIPGRNGGQSTIQPETLSRIPTEEADLSLSPSSLEFAKLIGISERSSGSHHRMGFSPSPGKAVTVASYLTGAFPLEFRASQSNGPIGSKGAPNAISRKRGVRAGILAASVGRHRVLSGGASIPGSYEVRTGKATPPLLRHQPQTEIGPLEEMMWETSGPKGTKPILEKKGGSLTPKSGRYEAEISTAATHARVEAKGSGQTGFGAPNLASQQLPQSTYSNSTEETEKLASVPEEKGSMESTVGLTNNPRWIPVSDTQMTEAASSVLGVQESPGTDKVERLYPLEVNSENMHLEDAAAMAEGAVTL